MNRKWYTRLISAMLLVALTLSLCSFAAAEASNDSAAELGNLILDEFPDDVSSKSVNFADKGVTVSLGRGNTFNMYMFYAKDDEDGMMYPYTKKGAIIDSLSFYHFGPYYMTVEQGDWVRIRYYYGEPYLSFKGNLSFKANLTQQTRTARIRLYDRYGTISILNITQFGRPKLNTPRSKKARSITASITRANTPGFSPVYTVYGNDMTVYSSSNWKHYSFTKNFTKTSNTATLNTLRDGSRFVSGHQYIMTLYYKIKLGSRWVLSPNVKSRLVVVR